MAAADIEDLSCQVKRLRSSKWISVLITVLHPTKSLDRSFLFQGIDVYTSELMEHLEYVQLVKEAKLVLFVWGAIDDTDTLNLLRGHGVDGIIYDRWVFLTFSPLTS
jgi:hypothetical protein